MIIKHAKFYSEDADNHRKVSYVQTYLCDFNIAVRIWLYNRATTIIEVQNKIKKKNKTYKK
jgi:hypothetical protein